MEDYGAPVRATLNTVSGRPILAHMSREMGNDQGPREVVSLPGRSRMSDELIAALRQRVQDRYYDQPQVIEIIAQAILHSRGLYL